MAAKILQFPQRMTPERQARVKEAPTLEEVEIQRIVDRLEAAYGDPRNVGLSVGPQLQELRSQQGTTCLPRFPLRSRALTQGETNGPTPIIPFQSMRGGRANPKRERLVDALCQRLGFCDDQEGREEVDSLLELIERHAKKAKLQSKAPSA